MSEPNAEIAARRRPCPLHQGMFVDGCWDCDRLRESTRVTPPAVTDGGDA